MKKQTDAYIVLKVWAVVAVLVASVATYDIAYHFSPADVVIFGLAISRSTIAAFTILIVDGLYIMLDLMLPKFRTANSRASAGYFMVGLWVIMLSLNISSAVLNKSLDVSLLGNFSFVVYFVKALAVIYLAWYTYVRYDDPETQRELTEMETREAREIGIQKHLRTYSMAFAREGAKVIAMEQLADYVFRETGKDIREVLGDNWREVLGGPGFGAQPELPVGDPPRKKPQVASPLALLADPGAGKQLDLWERIKVAGRVIFPGPDTGNPDIQGPNKNFP